MHACSLPSRQHPLVRPRYVSLLVARRRSYRPLQPNRVQDTSIFLSKRDHVLGPDDDVERVDQIHEREAD